MLLYFMNIALVDASAPANMKVNEELHYSEL